MQYANKKCEKTNIIGTGGWRVKGYILLLIKMCFICVLSGRLELKEDTVENLLSTACMLQLSEVEKACSGFLMKQLHPSNCIGIRQFADLQGCRDLYEVANNYVMVSWFPSTMMFILFGDAVCMRSQIIEPMWNVARRPVSAGPTLDVRIWRLSTSDYDV